MNELKPCPFCGAYGLSLVEIERADFCHYVRCVPCTTEGPAASNKKDAIAAWNKRAEVTE